MGILSIENAKLRKEMQNFPLVERENHPSQGSVEEEYDVIVLGTGLTECIISGLLSMEGAKVLHLDRNSHYGGDCASLNLSQLWSRFRPSDTDGPPASLGRSRDWNVDLVPKFMMALGELVAILVHTDVTRYIEFQQCAGSFVYRDGRICKVPASEYEALTSSLMGFFEKRRAKTFFQYLHGADSKRPETWAGKQLNVLPMSALFKEFGLEPGTQDFIGHALALYHSEDYLDQPALETVSRIRLYMNSMARFGKSPYVYPMYGLGELPQGFARLSAIYGGTYMLDKPVDGFAFDDAGRVCGVRSGEEVAKCSAVFCDPSYAMDRVKSIGRLIRVICILNQPIPNTSNSDSVQIIIPSRQVGRKYDIYIACVSATHQVCPAGFYIAIVSTIIETDAPEREIQPGLALLGPILEKFVSTSEIYEPIDDGNSDGIYVSRSYDATSHFETVCDDVKSLYKRYTGQSLAPKQRLPANLEQEQLEKSLTDLNI